MYPLRIAHFTTSLTGGAGKAASRIHKALIASGVASRIYIGDTTTSDPAEHVTALLDRVHCIFNQQAQQIINEQGKEKVLFSALSMPLHKDTLDKILATCDIIHLHWITGLLALEDIAYLSWQKPLVWTLHDKEPFTGGCHYTLGCTKWQNACLECPMVPSKYSRLASGCFSAKLKYFNWQNITPVVLCNQFYNFIEKSPLFKNCQIKIIANCLDIQTYKPTTALTKITSHLPKNKKLILFVADYTAPLKGYSEFCKATKLLQNNKWHIVLAGSIPQNETPYLPTTRLGYLQKQELIDIYNISDVTVIPSLEENGSNVLIESLACGTPIAGFKVGALPDFIVDGYNGYTVPIGDIQGLAKAICLVLEGPNLAAQCRATAIKHFNYQDQTAKYMKVYATVAQSCQIFPANAIPSNFQELEDTKKEILFDISNNAAKYKKITEKYGLADKITYKIIIKMLLQKIGVLNFLITLKNRLLGK